MTDATPPTRRRFLRGAAMFALATCAFATLGRLTHLAPARATTAGGGPRGSAAPAPGQAVRVDAAHIASTQSDAGAGHDPCLGAAPRA